MQFLSHMQLRTRFLMPIQPGRPPLYALFRRACRSWFAGRQTQKPRTFYGPGLAYHDSSDLITVGILLSAGPPIFLRRDMVDREVGYLVAQSRKHLLVCLLPLGHDPYQAEKDAAASSP